MSSARKYKVLIGLREVAGYCDNLKRGFDRIGVEAHFLNLGGNPFYKSSDNNPGWINFFNAVGTKIGVRMSRSFLLRVIWMAILQPLFSLPAFFIALFNYNVFILCSNSTFFNFLELPLLKLLGKKIIFVFMGSDSRPIYLGGNTVSDDKKIKTYILLAWIQKTVVRVIELMADACLNHPPQAYFHEKTFISSMCIGLPVNITPPPPLQQQPKDPSTRAVRILHAPSKSSVKGTAVFRTIIENLKKKGHNIDYVEVSGVPNAEVLRLIQTCDFVLDELYSDVPMAILASEAASCGKPTVVGGYYAAAIEQDIAKEYIPPSCFSLPDDIESAIEKMIVDHDYRTKLGVAAKEFLLNNWSPEQVARNYVRVFDNDIPANWRYDPKTLRYLNGAGLPEKRAKHNIRLFIEKGGIKSLRLSDKPVLEKAMREFAYAP